MNPDCQWIEDDCWCGWKCTQCEKPASNRKKYDSTPPPRNCSAHERYAHRSPPAAPKKKPKPRALPGTELKLLLAKCGIVDEVGCQCDRRSALMNQMGPDWCRQSIDTIVGWMQEEAEKRELRFVRVVAKLIVLRAIRNSRKKLAKALQEADHA